MLVVEDEIFKYDHMYRHHPNYGQIDKREPRFVVALEYIESIRDIRTILDVGTGRGGFYNIVNGSYDVWGIEPSRVAIERFHHDDKRILNISVQDLSTYIPADSFDAITCLDVIEHIPQQDLDTAFSSMAHVGKKHFIFSIANHVDICDGLNLHVSLFSYEAWEEKLAKHFKVISQKSIHSGRACVYHLIKNDAVALIDSNANQDRSRSISHNCKVNESTKTSPLISVLIPTYNHADYLPETLDSLISQTYKNWEAVIVNDGSTDNTCKVLNTYGLKDRRFSIFHKKNGGTGSALNKAAKAARSEWVCWLSSDDLFEQNALEIFAAAIKEHPNCSFFHSHFYLLDQDTSTKIAFEPDRIKSLPSPANQVIAFFKKNYVNGISIAINKRILNKVGPFSEKLKYAQDVDMWLRISALTPSYFINKRTCITRISSASGTQAFPQAGRMDVARLCINFLNSHKFPELFPLLNLDKMEDAISAIYSTIRIIVDTNSHMYTGVGYIPALMDRMCEWLSFDCKIKNFVLEQLEVLIKTVNNAPLPRSIKDSFSKLRQSRNFKLPYKPYDPLMEMTNNIPKLINESRYAEAKVIVKYLDSYNHLPRDIRQMIGGILASKASDTGFITR